MAPQSPRQSPSLDPTELVARGVIAGLFLGLAYRVGVNLVETGRLSGVLLLVSELLVVVLTLVRYPATSVNRAWWVRAVTAVSVGGPSLLVPTATAGLAEAVTIGLTSGGVAVVVAGKLSLGRSLGLLPANRGIVCTGLYRLMRHPIYLGYLIAHAGFVLGHPSLWNLTVVLVADAALLVRASLEEHTLAPDPTYRRYRKLVRWRLVPGIY